VDPAEDEQRDADQDRDEQEQPADDEAKHSVVPPPVSSITR
jgi:hypothetical protein